MPQTNFIREYLIKLGVDVSAAELNKLEDKLSKFDKGIIGFFKRINSASVIVGKSYLALMQKIYNFSAGIAKSDMDMQKWAKTMYMSTNSAKALDKTLSAMGIGVDDLQDVALNPELTRQYKELLTLSKQLTDSIDVSQSMRGIRAVTFEFQKMNLIWMNFKERVVHYLWKFLDSTTLKNFMGNLKAFNKWSTSHLDRVAEKVGNFLGSLIAVFTKLIDYGKDLYSITIEPIANFIKELPQGLQEIVRLMSSLGLALMAGPFGRLLWILQRIVLLMDDISGYRKGKKSLYGNVYKSLGIKTDAEEKSVPPALQHPQWVKDHPALEALADFGEFVGKGMIHLVTERFRDLKSTADTADAEFWNKMGYNFNTNNTNKKSENNYHIEINNKDPKGTVDELVARIRSGEFGAVA